MRLLLSFLSLTVILLTFAACEVETDFVSGNDVELRFSTDTIAFDTVFTARGSATQIMKVYNAGSEPVKIDRIRVEGQTGVSFIFNVDGLRGPVAEDVVIWGNDSIFVFVEVTVDPTAPTEVSPFIAEDRLVFETGDVMEQVVLLAFGQNANYVNGFRRGVFAPISCDNGTVAFPVDLPTVIYGSLVIDACTVQALAGTRIYLHGGVQRNEDFGGSGFFNDGIVFTTATGRLQLLGTADEPVIVRTDRLEPDFATDPGKYRGLFFGPGSRGNRLEHTQLLNAIVGIQLDSAAEVTIENSVIAYSGGPAVVAVEAEVTVRNSVFHSNFGDAIQFIRGGTLTMEHSTVANYGVDASALVLTNFQVDENNQVSGVAALTANIRNSILVGSRQSELALQDIFGGDEPGAFRVNIANSVVRTSAEFLTFPRGEGLYADFYEDECNNCYNLMAGDALFNDISGDDYQLDTLSVAQELGVFLPRLPVDILGVARDRARPDAGAFEREE